MTEEETFKINDLVFWRDRYYYNGHEGTILGIVPKGQNPQPIADAISVDLKCRSISTSGSSRNHESYIVYVATKNGKGRIFWPRVKNLIKTNEDIRKLIQIAQQYEGMKQILEDVLRR